MDVMIVVNIDDEHDLDAERSKLRQIAKKIKGTIGKRDYIVLSSLNLIDDGDEQVNRELGEICCYFPILSVKSGLDIGSLMREVLGTIQIYQDRSVLVLFTHHQIAKWLPIFFRYLILERDNFNVKLFPKNIGYSEATLIDCNDGQTTILR